MDLIKIIVEFFSGTDRIIVTVACVLALAGWFYLGRRREERAITRKQFRFVIIVALVAIGGIGINHLFFSKMFRFPDGVTGIVVLRIDGDPDNSLQRDLVSTLSREMKKDSIEVCASDEIVSDKLGLSRAHEEAREIGKKCSALIVVWGERVGETKFHPRITIASEQYRAIVQGDRELIAQSLKELSLPPDLVDEPMYLVYFVKGYVAYERENYKKALQDFERAISRAIVPPELSNVLILKGATYFRISMRSLERGQLIEKAVSCFDQAEKLYPKGEYPIGYAILKSWLGITYTVLPTGDRNENSRRAIAAYEEALRIQREASSTDWAGVQSNLGILYSKLSIGDRTENSRKAIMAFEAALSVYNEKDFRVKRAQVKNDLGLAYVFSAWGDRGVNLQKAINAFEDALCLRSEKDFPIQTAMVRSNLGIAYRNLPLGNRAENLEKAITLFKAALNVLTEKNSPFDWASTQNSLGNTYLDRTIGDMIENLKNAIDAFKAALRVYTEKGSPTEWALVQDNLCFAYLRLPIDRNGETVMKAIAAGESALRVRRENDDPPAWAATQYELGVAYEELPIGNRMENINLSLSYLYNALRVYRKEQQIDNIRLVLGKIEEARGEMNTLMRHPQTHY